MPILLTRSRDHDDARSARLTRRTLAGLLGGVPLLGAASVVGKKKHKKKKCRNGAKKCGKSCCIKGECTFKVKGNQWLLQADCSITQSIIPPKPDGLVIDGQGHTIAMTGSKSGYSSGGLAIVAGDEGGQVSIANLTINGAGLSEACRILTFDPADPPAIYLGNISASVTNVALVDIPCASALAPILNNTTPSQSVTISNLRVTSNVAADRLGQAIHAAASGPGRLAMTISGSSFTTPVLANTFTDATIDGCTFSGVAGSAGSLNGGNLTVSNSTFNGAFIALSAEVQGSTLTATGNTITGPSAVAPGQIAGIEYRAGSSGNVSGNSISNYQDPGPSVACGIRVYPGATPTIGTNTFPPPGNEQNVCYVV